MREVRAVYAHAGAGGNAGMLAMQAGTPAALGIHAPVGRVGCPSTSACRYERVRSCADVHAAVLATVFVGRAVPAVAVGVPVIMKGQ